MSANLTVGGLFAGYGGIELALHDVLGAEPAWFAEFDAAPSRVLAHHWPDVPNYGDVTAIDWSAVEPVDVLTAGYPCQPFSGAGLRLGTDDPRHLWPYVVEAVSALRPAMCLFENVQGHLSLGFDHVLRDLAILGYDVCWTLISAASVGAPHRRNRLFILATEARHVRSIRSRADRRGGLHRDSGVRRVVPGAPQGHDDGQGHARTPADETPVWREDRRTAARDGGVSRLLQLAADRSRSVGADCAAAPAPAGEGGVCGSGSRVPGDGGRVAAAAQRPSDLDCGDAGPGRGVRPPNPAREQDGPGRPDAATAGSLADSGLPLGCLVGAGERPVRAGGVHGPDAGTGADGGGSRVRPVGDLTWGSPEWRDLTLLKTPTSQLAVNGGSQHPDKRKAGGHGPTLADEVEHLLPTPAVNDMGASYTPEERDEWTARMQAKHGNGNGNGASLHVEALRLLPTPQAMDTAGATVDRRSTSGYGPALRDIATLLPTPRAIDGTKGGPNQRGSSGDLMLPSAVTLLPTPTSTDHKASGATYAPTGTHHTGTTLTDATVRQADRWGQYAAAIARWETLTRPAPDPTEPTGKGGAHRLSPRFVEWMMGLPDGWVTDVPDISRNDALRALGNGVVPQQAVAALRWLLATAADATRAVAS